MQFLSRYRGILEKVFTGLLLLIVFLLPTWGKVIPPLIAVACLAWLLHGDIKGQLTAAFRNPTAVLFMIFYFLHVAGMLYTENIKTGLSHLEVKFSLLLFPLILSGMREALVKNFNKVIGAFILGNLSAAIICLGRAVYYMQAEGKNYFYYTDLSIFNLPTYSSVYILFAIGGIFFFLTEKKIQFSNKMRWLAAACILLLAAVVFLNYSRAGVLSGIIAFVFTGTFYFVKRKKWLWLSATVVIPVIIGLGLIMYNGRFEPIRIFIKAPADSLAASSTDNVSVRYLVAKQGLQLVKENFWLGTGTGDVKDQLMNRYASMNIALAEHEHLNAHDQFMETFIGLGIAGFLLLLIMVLEPIYSGVRQNNILKIAFGVLVVINFLFESMLNMQAGVIFYAFFGTLLAVCFPAIRPREN